MAKYRQIQTSFWSDPEMIDLTPEQKFFYIYLMTNPQVSQCGIYEISLKQIQYETGYNEDTILKLIKLFEDKKKIKHSRKSNEICLMNFSKYNYTSSPQVKKHIREEFQKVKNKLLIDSIYGINSLFIGYQQEKEKEKEEEEEKEVKIKYADFVQLTEKQYLTLIEKYDKDNTQLFIDELNNYKGAHNKKYDSDYHAINSWVVKKVLDNKKQKSSNYYLDQLDKI